MPDALLQPPGYAHAQVHPLPVHPTTVWFVSSCSRLRPPPLHGVQPNLVATRRGCYEFQRGLAIILRYVCCDPPTFPHPSKPATPNPTPQVWGLAIIIRNNWGVILKESEGGTM